MELDYPDSLKGQLLLAMPGLADPNFVQSVTFLCEHTQAGAVGVIVNRTLPDLTGKDVFDELQMTCVPEAETLLIHFDGPVHTNEIFILHGPPFDWKGCLVITASLAMSNTIDILEAVAAGQGPKSFMLTLGCAGWGPGQLESEIKANAWLTSPVSKDIVFDLPVESKWETAMRKVGINPTLLSEIAGHA